MRGVFERLFGIACAALVLIASGSALASSGCFAVNSGAFNNLQVNEFTQTVDSFATGDKVSFNVTLGGLGSAWRAYGNFAANPMLLDSIANNSDGNSTVTFTYTVTGHNDSSLTSQLLSSAAAGVVGVDASCVAAPPPTVTGVSPNIVNAGGGTVITITGTEFSGDSAVWLTDSSGFVVAIPLAVTVNNPASITATIPPFVPGVSVDVRVNTLAGTSAANASDLVAFGVPSSTTIAAAPNPSRFGQPVTFSASVNESSGGTFTFADNGAPIGTASIDGAGHGSFGTSSLAVGSHPIAANYPGSFAAGILASSAVLSQVVNKADTSLSINSSAATSTAGQPVTFTAGVAVAAPGAGTPTGTVEFFDGATSLGSVAFLGTPVTLPTSSLAPGRHSITAIFSGDGNYNGVPSSVLTHTVNQAPSITSAAVHSFAVGANGSFVVTATGFPMPSISLAGAKPDGISFLDNHDGTATLSGATGTAGQFPLTVTAANGIGSDAQQNFTLNVSKGGVTIVASATPTAALPGQPVTLTASVTVTPPAVATPTGAVTFMNGATALGNLQSGVAMLRITSLAVGRNVITAVYPGDDNLKPTTSPRTVVTVSKGATGTTARALPTRAKAGATVTLEARVVAAAPAHIVPTGVVTFRQGAKTLGSGTLTAGRASASIRGLSVGSDLITAHYGGDGNLTASSAMTTIKVSAALGTESKVDASAAGSQQQLPAVAALTNGFVVAWASKGQDSSGFGVYAQRYTAAGAKAGNELHISTATAGNQTSPKVAGLTAGGFVVVWQSVRQDGSGYGIYGQRFTAVGVQAGHEFRINSTTSKNQIMPSVAPLSDGGFVVAWTSDGQDGAGLGIYAQRYGAAGDAVGAEFNVNKTKAGDQSNSAVAGLSGGGFVVTWQGPDASGLGIYAQRYDAAGNAIGKELAVNSVTVQDQSLPSIAALGNGGFVVSWQSNLQDGSGLGVYMQQYTSAGRRSGANKRVNTTTANDQGAAVTAAFPNGGYVIAWTSKNEDGSGQGVYVQAFDDFAGKANAEFRANSTTNGDQFQPAVAAAAGDTFVVVWTSVDQDRRLDRIYLQRFLVPIPHLPPSINARS
jgi:hypothetical protein